MRKEEKNGKQHLGKILLSGTMIFFIIYITGILLITWLISKELISPEATSSVLSVICLIGSFFSSRVCCKRIKWGTLITALLTTGIIALIIIIAGNCFPSGVIWSKENAVILICILVGSIAASLLSVQKPRKGKRVARKRVS